MNADITIDILLHGFEKYQESLGGFVCDMDDELGDSDLPGWNFKELEKIHDMVFNPETLKSLFELGLTRYKNLRISEHDGICISERKDNHDTYTCNKCFVDERNRKIEEVILMTEEIMLKDL